MKCDNCFKELAESAKFCRYCSAPQSQKPSALVCKKCDSTLLPNAKFCRKCGTKVEYENTAIIVHSPQTKNSTELHTTAAITDKVNNPNQAIYKKTGITKNYIAIGLVIVVSIILVFNLKSNDAVTEPSEVIADSIVDKFDTVELVASDEALQNQLIEIADKSAVGTCTFNVNRTIYDLVFNGGRVPPSIDVIGFYLQAKMQLHGVKLVQSKQTQSTVIAFDGTGIDSDSLQRIPLCVEKVPLFFSDGTEEDYLVGYLYDFQNNQYKEVTPIAPNESGKLIDWYNKIAAKSVRDLSSPPNTSIDFVGDEENSLAYQPEASERKLEASERKLIELREQQLKKLEERSIEDQIQTKPQKGELQDQLVIVDATGEKAKMQMDENGDHVYCGWFGGPFICKNKEDAIAWKNSKSQK